MSLLMIETMLLDRGAVYVIIGVIGVLRTRLLESARESGTLFAVALLWQ